MRHQSLLSSLETRSNIISERNLWGCSVPVSLIGQHLFPRIDSQHEWTCPISKALGAGSLASQVSSPEGLLVQMQWAFVCSTDPRCVATGLLHGLRPLLAWSLAFPLREARAPMQKPCKGWEFSHPSPRSRRELRTKAVIRIPCFWEEGPPHCPEEWYCDKKISLEENGMFPTVHQLSLSLQTVGFTGLWEFRIESIKGGNTAVPPLLSQDMLSQVK